jgi:hypothetical protein
MGFNQATGIAVGLLNVIDQVLSFQFQEVL